MEKFSDIMKEQAERAKTYVVTKIDHDRLADCITALLANYSGKDSKISPDNNIFFGYFILSMKRKFDVNLPTAAGVSFKNGYINLYINPVMFFNFPFALQVDILKHECLHVIFQHVLSQHKEDHKLLNIAMDLVINQCNLPHIQNYKIIDDGGKTRNAFWTLQGLADVLKVSVDNIKPNENYLYYLDLLKKEQEKQQKELGDKFSMVDDHGEMNEGSEFETLDKETLKHIVKSAKEKTQANAGNLTHDIELMINELLASKINWKKILQNFAFRSISTKFKKSRKRINKRYGLQYKGRVKEKKGHIAFIVDTSGSMSDEDIQIGCSEVYAIHKRTGIDITIINADCEVKDIQSYKGKKSFEISGRGGTAYQPAIDKALELNVNSIIYYGDMDSSDKPIDPKLPFVWLVKGKQNPPADFGRVLRIE